MHGDQTMVADRDACMSADHREGVQEYISSKFDHPAKGIEDDTALKAADRPNGNAASLTAAPRSANGDSGLRPCSFAYRCAGQPQPAGPERIDCGLKPSGGAQVHRHALKSS